MIPKRGGGRERKKERKKEKLVFTEECQQTNVEEIITLKFQHFVILNVITDLGNSLSAMQETRFKPWVRKTPWRREWLSTPVFLPGEFHGQRSLVGHSPWGHKESDTTEQLTHTHTHTRTHTSINTKTTL